MIARVADVPPAWSPECCSSSELVRKCQSSERCLLNAHTCTRTSLVQTGADEQLGGYGRHRTKYKVDGWAGLVGEMKFDVGRISHRNLGIVCSSASLALGLSAYVGKLVPRLLAEDQAVAQLLLRGPRLSV